MTVQLQTLLRLCQSMYKYITLIVILFFCIGNIHAKPIDEVYGGVSEGQTIFYSFVSGKWSYQKPKHFQKKVLDVTRYVVSDEKYSEYVSQKGQVYSPAGSNYEFLYKGRLIAYHFYDAKFYEIIYNKQNKAFIEIPLSDTDVKKIMGYPKLIRISQFDSEKKIIVHKKPFIRQWYLIVNDTDKYFYRYFLSTPQKDVNVRTYFAVKKPTTIMFSHYIPDKDEFPPYMIRIKNSLYKY